MDDNHDYISDELLAAFLDGNTDSQQEKSLLSALPYDAEACEILDLSSKIDAELERERLGVLPIQALAAANPENLCSFDCETFILYRLDYDIDHWSLLETAKANNWLREEGTPLHHVGRLLELKGLHVERKYDSSLENLSNALDNGKYVIAVVDRNILDGESDERNPSFHALYVTDVDDDDVTVLDLDELEDDYIDRVTFLDAWKSSGFYMVAASDDEETVYDPRPIDVNDIDLDADLEELTEAIAENAHDIWARARMDEGWTYGPLRDDAAKRHPDLVPYSRLPESEKEYDRIMAMNTLRLVRRLGFDITPLTSL